MNGKPGSNIYIATRDGALRSLLRAGLSSQGLTPLDIRPELLCAGNTGGGLAPEAESQLLVDLAAENRAGSDVPGFLRQLGALDWRPRVFAIAPMARAVWRNESEWCRRRTGLPLLPRPDTGLVAFLGLLLAEVGLGEPDTRRLDTHIRVLLGNRDEAADALVRRLTGDSAAALAAALIAGGQVADRRYHLKKYPQCLVGSAAVDWLCQRHGCTREQAVALGAALARAGYLHHVVKQQPFQDGEYFYRVAAPVRFDAVALDDVEMALNASAGLIADRAWRGINFPRCMVGDEAADTLCTTFRLTRAEATLLGQSLMDLGLLRHVADQHPFVDDTLFYELTRPAFVAPAANAK
ncbi:MAG: hypothetical protein HZA63_00555 [Rhodocyclales bacterium]|nr:hypothetical protein [Rhodocyclales bacterium]